MAILQRMLNWCVISHWFNLPWWYTVRSWKKHNLFASAVFKHLVGHDIWDKNIDNIRIFKSGEQKINSRDRAGGEGAHTNINKHSSSVSEASCFIWLGWGRREGWGWKTEQSCSFAFLPPFPSSAIFSLSLMGMGSSGCGGEKEGTCGVGCC